MKFASKVFTTFFGIGYFPVAPGTLTSLIMILLYKFYLSQLEWTYYLLLLILVFTVGVFLSSVHSTELNNKDPRSIVIDEALGQLLALFSLKPTWKLLLATFFLFRFFDVVKPFPIKKIESFPKGWGIMLDDIMAAIYAGVLIHIYLLLR